MGAIFHLIVGGGGQRLVVYLLAAWVGFGVGHVAGMFFDVQVFAVGSLRLLPALVGGGIALIFVYALHVSRPTAPPVRRERRRSAR
ncbi:MAG: hypothetical protein SF162_14555 [bacterium]|nr:hypothetical protein [bacterium]